MVAGLTGHLAALGLGIDTSPWAPASCRIESYWARSVCIGSAVSAANARSVIRTKWRGICCGLSLIYVDLPNDDASTSTTLTSSFRTAFWLGA